MEIRTLDDVKRLNQFLTQKVKAGQPVILSVENHQGPTAKQIRAINALVRDLAREVAALSDPNYHVTPGEFREMIMDMFLGDYLSLMPDGSVEVNKASFQNGTNKSEINDTIEAIIEYYSSNYGLNACIKDSSKPACDIKVVA